LAATSTLATTGDALHTANPAILASEHATKPEPGIANFAEVLSARLEHFITLIANDAHVRSLAEDCGLPPEKARLLLNTYCNEARVGLALIVPVLKPGLRVLEVGSGIGLVASVLADQGVAIVGIEPGAAGFGFMPALASIVTACIGADEPFRPLPIGR
jgi:2-polyprenyl-3-methyl-5-hydroxy-6-metoxy-1,4-benzoquinol methylase